MLTILITTTSFFLSVLKTEQLTVTTVSPKTSHSKIAHFYIQLHNRVAQMAPLQATAKVVINNNNK